MLKRTRYFLIKLVYILIDVVSASFSIYLACWLRQETLHSDINFNNLFFDPYNPYRHLFLFWVLVVIILNNSYGLYQTRREIYETLEIWQVAKSILLSALIIIVSLYVVRLEEFPRSILFWAVALMILTLSLWRLCKRRVVGYLVIQGYNNFNALIIGAGRVGMALTREIQRHPNLGIKILGYLDDYKAALPDKNMPSVLGTISEFAKIARREFVHEIFITIHHDSKVFLKLLEDAKDLGIAVRVIPQGFALMPSDFNKYNIGAIPVLEYSEVKFLRQQAGKRLFDIFASIVLGAVLLPFIVIFAIAIKLDSAGPVFYISRRFGRRGRIFNMLKFRSMVQDADKVLAQYKDKNEVDGPIFKIRNDPRVTQFGRLLRKYSLDELPQIFNVFIGDMSLVGPRPFPIEQIEKEDLRQLQRLEVRPGMTGVWQVRGRSDKSFNRLVKLDMWYINNWSFWLDLRILFKTLPAVLKGRGAY